MTELPASSMAQEDREDQEAVVTFLASPAAHGGRTPDHIETHLSHIFLAGDRAWKLKKARHWSVVNYATVALREHYCRKEFKLNQPNAPDLYLGVRPITNGTALAIDGDGEPVDWVIEMRRFPQDAQLDAIVDSLTITPALIDGTADAIARLHRSAPIRCAPAFSAHVRSLASQLDRDLNERIDAPALRAEVSHWARSTEATIERLAGRIDARGRHGFVRRCHGDLHLSVVSQHVV